MKKEQFIAWAKTRSWQLDRWGRIRSGYFAKLSISHDGTIVGMAR